MEKILAFIAYAYTILVTYVGWLDQLEAISRILMYLSAAVLSGVSTWYWIKNKGRGRTPGK